jgi:hypothetical protein
MSYKFVNINPIGLTDLQSSIDNFTVGGIPISTLLNELNSNTTNIAAAATTLAADINQAVLTTSSPSFQGLTLTNLTNDPTQIRIVTVTSSGVAETRSSTTIPRLVSVQYHLNTSQSSTTSAQTTLVFDTADSTDAAITYSQGTFTFNNTGVYTITANVTWASSAVGIRSAIFQIPYNTTVQTAAALLDFGATGIQILNCATTRSITAANTMLLSTFQNSGGSLNLIGTATNANNYCQINITGIINS